MKMPHANPGATILCAPAQSKRMDMSQEAFCAKIYRENAKRVSRGHHFVRACTVDMHMDMSQEAFCAEIYRENAKRVSWEQHFVPVCAVDMHMDMSHKRYCVRKFTGNMPNAYPWATILCQSAQSILCQSAQSTCTWTCHTRGIVCGNLYGKCQSLPIPPRLNTGP